MDQKAWPGETGPETATRPRTAPSPRPRPAHRRPTGVAQLVEAEVSEDAGATFDDGAKVWDLVLLWRHCVEVDGDLDALVSRLNPFLRTVLVGIGRSYGNDLSHDLVDDVTQEIYVRLLQNDRRVLRDCRARSTATIESYLRHVARSTLVDWMRARRAMKRGRAIHVSIDSDATRTLDLPSAAPSPVDTMYSTQLRGRFRRECRSVARGRGTALRDTWITERLVVDGWGTRETAHSLRLSPATVNTVLCRMRRELRRRGLMVPPRLNTPR